MHDKVNVNYSVAVNSQNYNGRERRLLHSNKLLIMLNGGTFEDSFINNLRPCPGLPN